jgi:hypothetical protein
LSGAGRASAGVISDYDKPFPPNSAPPDRRAETPQPPLPRAHRTPLLALAALVAAGLLIARLLRIRLPLSL